MTDFVALYRGRTVSEAELVALSADAGVVRLLVNELLGPHLKEVDPPMVARTVLNKRENAAIERIQENLIELAGDDPETAEVAGKVKTARGPDEVHTRLFRMEAIADLTDAVRDNQPKAAKAATEVSKASPKRGRPKKKKDDGGES